jgi:hypothetical protein
MTEIWGVGCQLLSPYLAVTAGWFNRAVGNELEFSCGRPIALGDAGVWLMRGCYFGVGVVV